MKSERYSDAQIMRCPAALACMCERGYLMQAENGVPVSELCRVHSMSNASFYKWRVKFGGMPSRAFCFARFCRVTGASMISELRAMADENRRLKRMDLPRLRSCLSAHLNGLSFKSQGAPPLGGQANSNSSL